MARLRMCPIIQAVGPEEGSIPKPTAENPYRSPQVAPLSTFSIDVDTASYTNVRRFLYSAQLPPPDAVRIEELINYFSYDFASPKLLNEANGEAGSKLREVVKAPIAIHTEFGPAFWKPGHHLLKIGLKGHEIEWGRRPATNLVFLLDVSGSMSSQNKLPLVLDALSLLVRKLDERDTVSIVVYAGASGLALPPTTANNQETIRHALRHLSAGGSTNGGEGIKLAYKIAEENFISDGVNRVILCTDGDFNVGVSNTGQLTRLIEEKAQSDVYLSVFGFGMGNLNDEMLEDLSNKGNGNYAYIDSKAEARNALAQGAGGTLLTIAKDVKIQVEFNPSKVKAYRLIGYENRVLNAEDFNDDTKDAGELGSGHTIVALYEVAPIGSGIPLPDVDKLKYQTTDVAKNKKAEWATVKLRYKWPDSSTSEILSEPVSNPLGKLDECSEDFQFVSAVAAWGMLLRDSPHRHNTTNSKILSVARSALGQDPSGRRHEFLGLVESAQKLLAKD